jgi:hypothetical protein
VRTYAIDCVRKFARKGKFGHDTKCGIWWERECIHKLIKDVKTSENVHDCLKTFHPHIIPARLSEECFAIHCAEQSEALLHARIENGIIESESIQVLRLSLSRDR